MTWDFGGRVWTPVSSSSGGTTTLLTYPGDAALASDADFTTSTHVLKTVNDNPADGIIYQFLKLDQTGFWIVGMSQDSSGVQSKILAYSPPLQQFKFPFTYGTSWSGTSDIHIPSSFPGMVITQSVDAVVDGYGTLMTPTSAHQKGGVILASNDVLRLRTKNTTSVSFGAFSNVSVTYDFNWYTKTGYSANIGADTLQVPQSVYYSTPGGSTSVADKFSSAEELLNLRLSANPVSNSETKIYYTLKTSGNTEVSVMDVMGRQVNMLYKGHAEQGQNLIPIDASKLSAGTYFIRVNAEGLTATRKLIITK